MTRRGFCGAGLAGLAGFGLGRAAQAQAGLIPQKVKIGLISSLFRDVAEVFVMFAMAPFKDYLEGQMKVKSELINGGDSLAMGRKLSAGELHLGVFHGLELAWATQRFPRLKPLFIAVNVEPVLHAHLVVRKDSGVKAVADLKGKSVGIPAMGREHCRVFLERRCVRPGVAPKDYYSRVTKVIGSSLAPLSALERKECTSALVDGIDWEIFKKADPAKAANLTPLVSSEPFPCAVVAQYANRLDRPMLERFHKGMTTAHQTENGKKMLQIMRITHFADVPANYDKQLEAAAEAYPLKG
jgi:ABC-type phosphate/phosphonate transport system substrate-binding protein